MNIEDIKVGETYNVRVKVNCFNLAKNAAVVWDCGGHPCYFSLEDFSPINPYTPVEVFKMTEIPETTPKYDPNRKLKKGDIVEPCQVKGRWHSVTWEGRSGIHFTVTEDEDEDGIVSIKDPDCKLPYNAAAVFFNLVTPVEEMEPFEVECDDDDNEYSVTIRDKFVCTYPYDSDSFYTKEQAKAAAEAECDRLNAEHRKEMEK